MLSTRNLASLPRQLARWQPPAPAASSSSAAVVPGSSLPHVVCTRSIHLPTASRPARHALRIGTLRRTLKTDARAGQAVAASTTTPSSSQSESSATALTATPHVELLASSDTTIADRFSVRWASGIESRFHHVWLRDHCRCPECYHPKTKQRLLDTFAIPERIEPLSVESTTEGLQVEWPPLLQQQSADPLSPSSVEGGEGEAEGAEAVTPERTQAPSHHSLYPWRWLMLNSYAPPLHAFSEGAASEDSITAGGRGMPPLEKVLWGRSIAQAPPSVTWDEVMGRRASVPPSGSGSGAEEQEGESAAVDLSIHDQELADRGLLKWLQKLAQYGFCFVRGLPATPEATEALVRRIAFIRETHYGGFWDFTSNLEHGDTAYTNLKLQAHTDTTYFTDPAGLQLFHLLSHTDGAGAASQAQGGESLLVDGFLAAKILRESNEEAYRTLSEVRIMTHSAGDDDTLIRPLMEEGGYPILQHEDHPVGGGDEGETGSWRSGKLRMVRYNNDDRSVLRVPEQDVERFYKALREWNRILTDPEGEYWQQLTPGTAVSESRRLGLKSAALTRSKLTTFPFSQSLTTTASYMVALHSSATGDCAVLSKSGSAAVPLIQCSHPTSDGSLTLILTRSVSHDDYRSRLAVLRARFGDSPLGDGGRKHGRGVWDDGL